MLRSAAASCRSSVRARFARSWCGTSKRTGPPASPFPSAASRMKRLRTASRPAIQAFGPRGRVLEKVYGKAPASVRMGSTLPAGALFKRLLGIDTVFFSFSTADEDFHSPNEFFRVRRLHEGLEAWARYWESYARA